MSANLQHFNDVLQALASRRWAVWLFLAAGCSRSSLKVPDTDSSVDLGGATSRGGASGQAGEGSGGLTGTGGVFRTGGGAGGGGIVGGGGAVGTGGTPGTAGNTGSGGLIGTGGVFRTGGSVGGIIGTGGAVGAAGTPSTGGKIGSGGLSGSGGVARTGGVGGTDGGGGAGGTGGTPSSGGAAGSDGRTGSGGVTHTGGVAGSGGVVGTGGAFVTGGTLGSGGGGGMTGGGGVLGMPCTANQDCPSDATCCDGSDPGCDRTRLPSGDGANPGEFVVSADDLTVTDTIAGLVWQRDNCSAPVGCSDTNLRCTWSEAQAYCASLVLGGTSGWRLPAWMELLTVLDFSKTKYPFINQTVFPDTTMCTSVDRFWTSTLHAAGTHVYVDFAQGSSSYCDDTMPRRVICVRGSRCYPKSRFVVLDGGLVRDTLTGLVWQQQGSTTEMTWADAQSYCSSLAFRLPTLKELDSTMDPTSTSGGPIDQTAFPNTGTQPFWTSSLYEGSSLDHVGDVRYGDFFDDYSNQCELGPTTWLGPTGTLPVRCVR